MFFRMGWGDSRVVVWVVFPGHGAGPPRRGRVDLHREAADLESAGGQGFQVVQFLQVAVADVTADPVPFPDDRRIALARIAFRGVGEGRVPTPGVGAGQPHAVVEEIAGGLAAHAAAGVHVVRVTVAGTGGGVDHDDLERAQPVADAVQFGGDVVGGDHVAVGEVPEVEFDRRLQTPLQRDPVDRGSGTAAVHDRGIVVGGVEMGAVVGGQVQAFDRPALPVGQVPRGGAGEEGEQVGGGVGVGVVFDLGKQAGRVGGDAGPQRYREVDESAHGEPCRGQRARAARLVSRVRVSTSRPSTAQAVPHNPGAACQPVAVISWPQT